MKASGKEKLLKAWTYTKLVGGPLLSFLFPLAAPAITIGLAAESVAESELKSKPKAAVTK